MKERKDKKMEAEMKTKKFTKEELGISVPLSELHGWGFGFEMAHETIRGTIISTSEQDGQCSLYVSVPYVWLAKNDPVELMCLLFSREEAVGWYAILNRSSSDGHCYSVSGKLRVTLPNLRPVHGC